MNSLSRFSKFLDRAITSGQLIIELFNPTHDKKDSNHNKNIKAFVMSLALASVASVMPVALADEIDDVTQKTGIAIQFKDSGISGAEFKPDGSYNVYVSTSEVRAMSARINSLSKYDDLKLFVAYHESAHVMSLKLLTEASKDFADTFHKRIKTESYESIDNLGKNLLHLGALSYRNDRSEFDVAYNKILNSDELKLATKLQAITFTQELTADAVATLALLKDGRKDIIETMLVYRKKENAMFPVFSDSNEASVLAIKINPLYFNNHNTHDLMSYILNNIENICPNIENTSMDELVKLGINLASEYYDKNTPKFDHTIQNDARLVGDYFREGSNKINSETRQPTM